MNPLIYKVIHLAGIMGLFTALGGAIAGNSDCNTKRSGIIHGISLILIIVSGFGMIAKLGLAFKGWLVAKTLIWFVMGGIIALANKKKLKPAVLTGIILGCGALAAWLGVFKPF